MDVTTKQLIERALTLIERAIDAYQQRTAIDAERLAFEQKRDVRITADRAAVAEYRDALIAQRAAKDEADKKPTRGRSRSNRLDH